MVSGKVGGQILFGARREKRKNLFGAKLQCSNVIHVLCYVVWLANYFIYNHHVVGPFLPNVHFSIECSLSLAY